MSRLALILLSLCCAALPATAQDAEDAPALDDIPHITMVGTATATVTPDIGTIALGVTTNKPSARAAADENARQVQAVIDTAKAQGVGAPDIATQSVTLTQTFDDLRAPDGRIIGRRATGFTAENVLAIRLRDLAKLGALAQLLIDKGANRFDGISFDVETPGPILTRLTAAAVADAHLQAQSAADAAGVRLGRVLLIVRPETNEGAPLPMPMRTSLKAFAPTAALPVEAGTTTFTRAIAVTWALEPK